MTAPILFLDVDGVLNHHNVRRGPEGFHPECMKRFDRVTRETGCLCVLTSTWRRHEPLPTIEAWMRNAGAPETKLIGCTPYLITEWPSGVITQKARGDEIREWLRGWDTRLTYAVVDDSEDASKGHYERYVRTTFDVGLADGHADRLIALLKEPRRG